MKFTIDEICHLFDHKGSKMYGAEAVTQLEHALQTANLALQAGETRELITACLLHDLGHLIHNLGEDPAAQGVDDKHECGAIPFLGQIFGVEVTEPIRLHVLAKRYLCAVDSQYWQGLSPASQRSLQLQGGIFSPQEAEEFIRLPFAPDAVKLRIYDDQAKVPHLSTPELSYFVELMPRS